MFTKKQEKDPLENIVECEECKLLLKKENAQTVIIEGRGEYFYNDTKYYCPLHKKPYNRKRIGWGTTQYFATLEVDEDGKPIKK